jgi:hypothetical protein
VTGSTADGTATFAQPPTSTGIRQMIVIGVSVRRYQPAHVHIAGAVRQDGSMRPRTRPVLVARSFGLGPTSVR